MLLSIQALARSNAPLLQGAEYRLHSRFSQAINLSDTQGKLLTLHRFGKGCSPTGWVFRTNDFERLTERLNATSLLCVEGERLVGSGLNLCAQRKLDLSAPRDAQLSLPDLRCCTVQTGLVGPINEAFQRMDHPHLITLRDGIAIWQAGGKPDWSNLIGLGPGLTPSGDDMLTGAMAALFCHGHLHSLPTFSRFLPPFDQLLLMTTSVSCTFLNNAVQGRFSTPLLRLIRSLATGRDSRSAITHLLAHGHTSGADTLIGFVTALRWMKETEGG